MLPSREEVAGVVRHVMTIVGGYLIGSGVVSESMMMELTAVAVSVAGIAWSVVQKRAKRREVEEARTTVKSGLLAMAGALALAVLLSGCALTTSGQLTDEERARMTPQLHVYSVRGDYNRLLRAVADYARQPTCTDAVIVECSEPEVVRAAFNSLVEVDEALDAAEAVVRSGGEAPEGLISGARRGLATLSTYLIAKEVIER